jgi:hypothetical protein
MMIVLNVLFNWPNGGAVDFGAESFGLEADDALLGVSPIFENVIFTPDAVDAQNVDCVHFLPLRTERPRRAERLSRPTWG